MEELIREQDLIIERLSDLEGQEQGLDIISPLLSLPGLRAFWPMSVFDSSGNAIDISGQGRTLTYNGNPTYNRVTTFNAPYLNVDGTGDYLSRADEAHLDLTGGETYISSDIQGITLWGWFWVNAIGSNQGLMTKDDVGSNRSYSMYINTSGNLVAEFFSSGANSATSSGTITAQTWHNLAVRFVPSTSVDVYLDTVKTSNTTSIPATVDSTAANFNVGARNASLLLTGRISLCALYASALTDADISNSYQSTRAAFGV